jgi:hypothetical protein
MPTSRIICESVKRGNTMDQGQAITAIVAGSTLITASFFAKRVYAAKGILGAPSSNRLISTWKGRLLFWVVGGFMILVGLNYFLIDH